ncbi:hypothetical protein [Streptomyces sedi]|uniref:Sugar kinase n=1 Tax=Streptomyces sedi TaxID=555059 RepID=A0A5C4V6Q1_9ACTN|nr:hypothetical protein [Streptomyces sedi]TNM31622.1 hypothetical protein FH715_08670 [Streptomyces sedi]
MTTPSTTPPGGGTPEVPLRPPHRPRHRWLVALIVLLLIAIPAGYMVHSAYVSRESGEDKARSSSARTLVYEWPSKVQRRIYDVPVPGGSAYVGHFETNAWDRSAMYVEFRCSPSQLSGFLEELGTSRAGLVEGTVTIPSREAQTVGWAFDEPGRIYAGTIVRQSEHEPEVAITVDLTKEERPRVFAYSVTEP